MVLDFKESETLLYEEHDRIRRYDYDVDGYENENFCDVDEDQKSEKSCGYDTDSATSTASIKEDENIETFLIKRKNTNKLISKNNKKILNILEEEAYLSE